MRNFRDKILFSIDNMNIVEDIFGKSYEFLEKG